MKKLITNTVRTKLGALHLRGENDVVNNVRRQVIFHSSLVPTKYTLQWARLRGNRRKYRRIGKRRRIRMVYLFDLQKNPRPSPRRYFDSRRVRIGSEQTNRKSPLCDCGCPLKICLCFISPSKRIRNV